jgi:hypothetical protein
MLLAQALDAAAPVVVNNTTFATVVIAGIVTILGILIPGIVAIIKQAQATKSIVVASAQNTIAAGMRRDRKIQEIHLLVNSRLLTVLRLLVAVTKKEAERTEAASDIDAYETALRELTKAEASAKEVERVGTQDAVDEDRAASQAAERVAAVIAKGKDGRL